MASLLHMTVAEVQARMSVAEFIEWQAYIAIEPLGEHRADIRTALLMQQQLAIWKEKNAKLPELDTFIADWWGQQQPAAQPPLTLAEKFRMATGG